jgi:hypothetical protein
MMGGGGGMFFYLFLLALPSNQGKEDIIVSLGSL